MLVDMGVDVVTHSLGILRIHHEHSHLEVHRAPPHHLDGGVLFLGDLAHDLRQPLLHLGCGGGGDLAIGNGGDEEVHREVRGEPRLNSIILRPGRRRRRARSRPPLPTRLQVCCRDARRRGPHRLLRQTALAGLRGLLGVARGALLLCRLVLHGQDDVPVAWVCLVWVCFDAYAALPHHPHYRLRRGEGAQVPAQRQRRDRALSVADRLAQHLDRVRLDLLPQAVCHRGDRRVDLLRVVRHGHLQVLREHHERRRNLVRMFRDVLSDGGSLGRVGNEHPHLQLHRALILHLDDGVLLL
mmetsp:Transcript_1315/g.3177  ORF Transcript_1315/g.3177 Transcript_1315/m.3177 type:complete len:298 (-) Transcript_1315:148-1041(-)